MIRPTLGLAAAVNRALRQPDEWFDEPDDLERLQRALQAIDHIDDPVEAAAVLAFRIARARAFGEANKRTALLLARWLLDRNGRDGPVLLPPDDTETAEFLILAASEHHVEAALVSLLKGRDQRN